MTDYSLEYRNRIIESKPTVINKVTPGQIISFFHNHEWRIALVLNPRLEGKLHAITLLQIPPRIFERMRGTAILVPMDVHDNNVSAHNLYEELKIQINKYSAYRSYKLENVYGIEIVDIKEEGPQVKEEEDSDGKTTT